MSSSNIDVFIDRLKLKSELKKWRALALVSLAFLAIALFVKTVNFYSPFSGHIARITFEGIILENKKELETLRKIKNNNQIKALIVHINSPGGSAVGSELILNELLSIKQKKPVVVVMGSAAASGGYMISLAADQIFASSGTITGSIGVIFQMANITELSKKIGVDLVSFKSSELKGTPSPFEEITPKAQQVFQKTIDDYYNHFVNLVSMHRNINIQKAFKLSDGRIYSGQRAKKLGLVDQIGSEQEAIQWLIKNKNITPSLQIRDIELKSEKPKIEKLLSSLFGSSEYLSNINSQGIMTIWQPNSAINN